MIIGALIIKHKKSPSDIDTIQEIRENPYMQYMLGLTEYADKPIFDPPLFVTIRKRITIEDINAMTLELAKKNATWTSPPKVKPQEQIDKERIGNSLRNEVNADCLRLLIQRTLSTVFCCITAYKHKKDKRHRKVTTTQVYVKIVGKKNEQAAETIVLDADFTK